MASDQKRRVGFRSGFGFFGRHEISIFLVLRMISDGFPLNPTYGLNRDREKISIALPVRSLDLIIHSPD